MRIIRTVIAIAIFWTASVSLATTLATNKSEPQRHKQNQIVIYADPQLSASKVRVLSPSQRLIPIYQQGDWVNLSSGFNSLNIN